MRKSEDSDMSETSKSSGDFGEPWAVETKTNGDGFWVCTPERLCVGTVYSWPSSLNGKPRLEIG